MIRTTSKAVGGLVSFVLAWPPARFEAMTLGALQRPVGRQEYSVSVPGHRAT